eukprot:4623303-Amphidinium_carterae.1
MAAMHARASSWSDRAPLSQQCLTGTWVPMHTEMAYNTVYMFLRKCWTPLCHTLCGLTDAPWLHVDSRI